MSDIQKLVRIQLLVLVLFILNKFLIRPAVLKGDYWAPIDIFVLSFPNLCEAIIGVITLTYIALVLRDRFLDKTQNIQDHFLYILVTLVAAVYVLLQEFKVHNLGGNNTYDPYDVLFSIIGLFIGYAILVRLKPQLAPQRS